jgi:hypothetical protein
VEAIPPPTVTANELKLQNEEIEPPPSNIPQSIKTEPNMRPNKVARSIIKTPVRIYALNLDLTTGTHSAE